MLDGGFPLGFFGVSVINRSGIAGFQSGQRLRSRRCTDGSITRKSARRARIDWTSGARSRVAPQYACAGGSSVDLRGDQ
jgi:hypothetical protein